jgi:predicted nucleic acid-binding Zn ribbon protein
MEIFECEYCKKICKSKNSLRCHEIRCKLNPNVKVWNNGVKKGEGRPAWNKGLTKDTDKRMKKRSETFHKRIENGEIKIQGHPHSKETKERLSRIRSEYLASAENAGGFKDVGWYKISNVNNEEFIVRGLWEYNVALKLNDQNILWIRNQYLNYFIDDVKKTYNPDFYLPEFDEFIEVKGFFSEKDKIKMDAVIDQDPNIKIRFMKEKEYYNFINGNILISEIPIYEFGKFESGYKRKGHIEIKKEMKYCLVCGNEIPNRQKYCSSNCANASNKKIKLSNEEKIDLLKTFSIQEIADRFNISYNAVKKWKMKLMN